LENIYFLKEYILNTPWTTDIAKHNDDAINQWLFQEEIIIYIFTQ
jgi:hypothetical protein